MAFWSSLRHNGRRFAALTPPERGLVLRAAILLPLMAVGRRLVRFKRLQGLVAWLFPLTSRPAPVTETLAAQRIARAVSIAARHGIVRANCLERSLVLWGLLRRAGIPSALQLGARVTQGRFEAHAWVDIDGVAVNDAPDVRERFTPVLALPE